MSLLTITILILSVCCPAGISDRKKRECVCTAVAQHQNDGMALVLVSKSHILFLQFKRLEGRPWERCTFSGSLVACLAGRLNCRCSLVLIIGVAALLCPRKGNWKSQKGTYKKQDDNKVVKSYKGTIILLGVKREAKGK